MELVVFGDFNCPYSALASARVARLEATGAVAVDWRAVEHDPAIPPAGEPLTGPRAAELDQELARVRELLQTDEVFQICRPEVLPNTAALVAAFAAAEPDLRPGLRRRWFRAIWEAGADPSPIPRTVGGAAPGAERGARWQSEWRSLGCEVVPVLVRPDGTVHPGVDALEWLAGAWLPAGAPAGGEGPCLAPHLTPDLAPGLDG